MKTQIATNREQSRRLLDSGVTAETADMAIDADTSKLYLHPYLSRVDKQHELPAWSLSALLGLLTKEIEVDESPYDEVQEYVLHFYPYAEGWEVEYQYSEDDEYYSLMCVNGTNPIAACVKAIEWLTSNGYKLNEK